METDLKRNWAGNYRYRSEATCMPENLEQVQEIVAASPKLKALGTRHSFNGIADTDGLHLSLQKMNRILDLDRVNRRVTVEGGIRYGELGRFLHDQGFALPNLASLPHITVAGACATASHGSGDTTGTLAASVHALLIVTANGDAVEFSRDQPERGFAGAAAALGGLGVTARITLDVIPTFRISQTVYEQLPLDRLEGALDEVFASAYSVSLFTDWRQEGFHQVWLKSVAADAADAGIGDFTRFGVKPADGMRHPAPGFSPVNCNEQMGVPGAWHERLPHFRLEFTPSSGEELQSEYLVARRDAYAALRAISGISRHIAPLLYVSEVRSIAKDDLWMSPCYGRDSISIHFTWKPDWAAVRQVLPLIEERLAPYDARPHWGKVFAMASERVQPLYEKLPDFRQLLLRHDPQGKFRNALLESYILA